MYLAINLELAGYLGIIPSVYQIADGDGATVGPGSMVIKSDQFHGMALATAVRSVLEFRQKGSSEKTATAEEIYIDLIRGGYEFDTKDRDKATHGLKVSLGKNPVFRSVGQTGRYGLSDWYGGPRKREKSTDSGDSGTQSGGDDKAKEKAAEGANE